MKRVLFGAVLVACGGSKPAPPPPPDNQGSGAPPAGPTWETPAGWRGETIPFPLDFAPALAHAGVEELRFPPGFFKPESPEYWSYAFVWRTTDDAMLDGMSMGRELTVYFRGLVAAVDEEKKQVTKRDEIVARAVDMAHPAEDRGDILLALSAHVFDAFGDARPVDLSGTARRTSCPGGGALWTFVLAPNDEMLGTLGALAAKATCDQKAPPPAPEP